MSSVTINTVVFIDVDMARPRSRPARKKRSDISATAASIQSAFQRLSVRYSIDLRKNAGITARISVDHAAMRSSYSRRAITKVDHSTTAHSTSMGRRM